MEMQFQFQTELKKSLNTKYHYMKWDRNEWQGRSEENVRFSNWAVALSLTGTIVTIVVIGLYYLIIS
jgi:hypothetical protein